MSHPIVLFKPKIPPLKALILCPSAVIEKDLDYTEKDGKIEIGEEFEHNKKKYNIRKGKIFTERNWRGRPKQRYLFYNEGKEEPLGLASPSSTTAEEMKLMKYGGGEVTRRGIATFIQRKVSLSPKLLIFIAILVAIVMFVILRR